MKDLWSLAFYWLNKWYYDDKENGEANNNNNNKPKRQKTKTEEPKPNGDTSKMEWELWLLENNNLNLKKGTAFK